MATTRTFQDMLNQYLPNQIFTTEMVKRDYILKNVEKIENWKDGPYIVPFEGAYASSISFGALTASNDVSEDAFVRGSISAAKELWGTMIFNHRDLMEHDGKIPETTFLKILPDRVDNFIKNLKTATSQQLGSGPHFARVMDSTNAATGIMVVDKVDRFTIGQKVTLDDDNSSSGDYYVIAVTINVASSEYGSVTLSATRGGAAADVSAYTAAQNAKFYHPGVLANGTFVSFRAALLSAANGGDSSLYGVSKLAYPHLQAVNVDGSSVTASNILDKIFDFYVQVRQKARGAATKIICSYKHMGAIMKLLEVQKGPFKVTKEPKADVYGWWEVGIAQLGNGVYLDLVALQEWDDDLICAWDPSSVKFASNGMFRKRKSPDGKEYFEVRNTTGYQYIIDVCLFGEMAWHSPGNNGIMYGISLP